MCIKNTIRLVPATVLLAVALIVCAALPARAQISAAEEAVVTVVDSVAVEVDSTAATTPEWYVEPVIPEAKRAPRRAKAAKCSLDSTLSFNVDSVLVEVSAFQYDDADRVTSKTVYACNPDGSRVGTFREEYGFDANGTQVMTAVYEWVSASNKWKGTEKTEFAYEGELMIQRIDYIWVNEAWVADKKYTWKYDDQERVPEYYEYTRDKNTNKLVYSKGRIQEWDSEDRQILDIQYTAYSNGAWTAGTKKETTYDANGNKTEYTYYAGLTNGNWGATGSTRELWTYDGSNTKTKYEKYTWSNGWVGSNKEEWGYTGGKQTMYAKYAWSNGAWVGVSKEEWNYASGKQTLYAKYTWQNGAWVGVSKEEWEYTSAGKDQRHEKFTWSSGAWQTTEREDWTYNAKGKETLYKKQSLESGSLVIAARRTSEYDGSGNQTLLMNEVRKNGALVGTTKETWVYTSGKMTQHNKFVWGSGDWTDSEEEIWAYTSGNETNYEKYAWESGVKTGKTKRTSEYTSGKKTQQINWAWESGAWVNSDKEVWAYTSGKLTLNEKYNWVNGAWVGLEKEEWEYTSGKNTLHATYAWYQGDWVVSGREGYDLADNQTLVETYTITATNYKGSKKEEYTFNAAGKMTDKYVYKWVTADKVWVYNTWNVTGYDAAGNKTETCKYTWKNDAWKGSGTRELSTYNSDKKEIEHISQTWSASALDWVNSSRITTTYTNGVLMQEADFTWDGEKWVSGFQKDYYYNAAGQNYLTMTIKFNGTDWENVDRTEITYNDDGDQILSKTESWDGEKWVTTSMEKTEIVKDDAGRTLLNATSKCSSDLVWIGIKKDAFEYSSTGKLLSEGHYKGWAGGDWVPSYICEWQYDEADHEILRQRFDWENNAWVGHYRYEHEYDAQGREIMNASYLNWNTSTSSWRGSAKYSYEYDANGNKTKEIIYQWGPDGWEYLFANVSVYDSSNRVVQLLSQRYKSGTWNNDRLYIKEYSGSTQTKDNSYTWESGSWVITTRNEKYYDNDSQAKLRKEVVGTWNGGVVVSFEHNQYSYACDPHYFTIRFVDEDGTELESNKVKEGEVPVYSGATPTKQGDAQYTYTFKGWDKALVAATAHATYTATYTQTTNKYTITFQNEDGTTIESKEWAYGATPTCAEPTKAATDEYIYTFAGWDPSVAAVTGDATYTATFTTEANLFTITWVDGDGKTLKTEKVAYGVTPAYTGATPTKSETAQYAYAFNNIWLPTIVAVTADATYTAQFSSTVRTYTVTYLDDASAEISHETLAYGTMPDPAAPTKTATAQYTYTFDKWIPALAEVTGDATYKASFTSTVNEYTITWKDGDGKTLKTEKVAYGDTPAYTGTTPVKEGDAQYSYTFKGWDKIIVAVTDDATYTAQFSQSVNKYTITFKNEDGTKLEAKQWEYGTTPTCAAPEKATTAQYTYEFAGWTPIVKMVTEDATYTATFASHLRSYTVKFLYEDGSVFEEGVWDYGCLPLLSEEPTKAATAQYTYTFAGWTPAITNVTGAATYTATYTSVVNKYTITWVNDDNTLIDQTVVEYGTVPTHADATKENTAEYTYTFAGWDNTPVAVTGDATYKATFDATKNKYTITWLNDDNTLIDKTTVEYGVVPTHADASKENTAEYTYTFAGWDNTPVAVTGDATYKATFSATKNKYIITWLNDDNTLIDNTTVEYGIVPTHADASKENTAEYTYTFAGWDNTPVEVTGDATYKATFDATKNKYTITWLNDDETLIDQTTVEYGVVPTHADASKEATAEYTYTFAGWDNTPVAVTGDATYKATFSATKNKYIITWLNDDNTLIDNTTVEYGIVPTHADASKEATAEYTYTFAGWDNTPVAVTGDATYKATFSATKNKYTITWLNDDESLIDKTTVEYGVVPTHADASKENTAEYTYTFAGWDNTPVEVTDDATYKATFSSTKNKYTITWLNDDESLIDQTIVEYGVVPEHADASKVATAEYTYTFTGWDIAPVAVTGDATYKATFEATKNKYTITWLNDGDTQIDQTTVEYGVVPEHADATKENTAEYTYTFTGWDNTPVAVTGDATYKATFSATKNEYTITWVDGDGNTLKTEQVAYGETPEYVGDAPAKEETAQYTYEFNNTWSPEVVAVTGDATYTAQFTSIVRKYTITVTAKGWSQQQLLPYGTDLTELVAQIVETFGDQYVATDSVYTLVGWSPELQTVTENATYEALYIAEARQYTITWKDEDGTILDEQEVDYGQLPEYAGETPTKEEDEQFTYTFSGWNTEVVVVSGDATYVATYAAEEKPDTGVNTVTVDEPAVKVIENDLLYIIRGGMKWAVQGARVK